jgi:hypothetical protein
MRFPEHVWFVDFASRLEAHPDFVEHGRWFDSVLAFRCGSVASTLVFQRGIVSRVYEGIDGYDILLNGTASQWRDFLSTDLTLVRLHRNALMDIRGDAVRIMQNWKALFFITQILKSEANLVCD